MNKRGLILLLLLFLAGASLARDEETLEQLKERAQHAKGAEQARICVEVARRQLESADKLYTEGDPEKARAVLDEVASYSEKAGDAARSSGKHLKDTEIQVRRISRKLADIRRTINLEDRPAVDAAIERVEKVRSDILGKMFAKEKRS